MFYHHKGTQLNNYDKGTQLNNVLLPQGCPTKPMYHKGNQLNKCFNTTRAPN